MYTFKELHQQKDLLLLANVWDVPSAKVAEDLGMQAIGTSSGAMASLLGYPDGEGLPFAEMAYLVGRIAANTTLPLSVDLEAGYSRNPEEVVQHVVQLAKLGVVGINIEDSLVIKGQRVLRSQEEMGILLQYLVQALQAQQVPVFINVRIDTFVTAAPQALEETKKRIQHYAAAGADGIFLPCLTDLAMIQELVNTTALPLNLMAMPSLPSWKKLQELGVKRLSMGDFAARQMQQNLKNTIQSVLQQQSFAPLFQEKCS